VRRSIQRTSIDMSLLSAKDAVETLPEFETHLQDSITEIAEPCTIVVPCYNEGARLRMDQFRDFLEAPENIRLLFVNDGSRDNTLDVLREIEEQYPSCVRVLDQDRNRGKAEAVRSGMLRAIAQADSVYTGFWDADLATPLDDIAKMRRLLAERTEIDMVFGARVRLLGRSIERHTARHYLGRCFATCVSLMLGLPIYDTQCGAKIFRITPDLEKVLSTPFDSRWIFDVEIIARFLQLHKDDPRYAYHAIYEYPLEKWEDVAGSKVHSSDFFKALFDLMRIRSRYSL
jgi:dolichyl-phosphate beta-glucosyltransferase